MSLSKKEIKELKAQAQEIKPKILVGKNGLTEGTLQSIDEVLTADEIVKIKFLNNSIDVDQALCEELADAVEAELVQKIGRMVVLYREKL
ncbi:MAG: YhbY family RNA-binding protein [Peptococcaceae bacterium]|nr:YhbY family RNA-binding protein [Peptococcaceae bacterium]